VKPNPRHFSLSPARLGGLFALLMIGFAAVGGVRNYTPIPYWDMWDSTLNLMLRLRAGDTAVWWAQHNEHRIILSRALFWIDYKLFDGLSYFLIFMNYVLCALAAGALYLFMKKITHRDRIWTSQTWALLFFLGGSLFLWTQIENFAGAFQSQFFLAQLLPLLAFYFLARSVATGSWSEFGLASLFGTLSAGSMAIGVVVAPLMLGYALVLRQGLARATILGSISAVVLYLYLGTYVTSSDHPSLGSTLLHHPVGVFNYAMMFLGSPFNFLVGGERPGKLVAFSLGIVFTLIYGGLARRWFCTVEHSPFIAGLLFFIAYIGVSAVAAGCGRLFLGEASVFSYRYTTPAIMAWAALLLLLWHRADDRPVTHDRRYPIGFVAIGVLMLAYQVTALKNVRDTLFPREVAALALSLDIKDDVTIQSIYPHADRALMLSRAAKTLGLSIFGQPPYADFPQEMGSPRALPDAPACLGALDVATPVAGAPAYLRVVGWIFDPRTRSAPGIIRFIGDGGLVEGIAMVGGRRDDVRKLIDGRAGYSGFAGYVRAGSAGTDITASSDGTGCMIRIHVPSPG
jgi:hypothetical protein